MTRDEVTSWIAGYVTGWRLSHALEAGGSARGDALAATTFDTARTGLYLTVPAQATDADVEEMRRALQGKVHVGFWVVARGRVGF